MQNQNTKSPLVIASAIVGGLVATVLLTVAVSYSSRFSIATTTWYLQLPFMVRYTATAIVVTVVIIKGFTSK